MIPQRLLYCAESLRVSRSAEVRYVSVNYFFAKIPARSGLLACVELRYFQSVYSVYSVSFQFSSPERRAEASLASAGAALMILVVTPMAN